MSHVHVLLNQARTSAPEGGGGNPAPARNAACMRTIKAKAEAKVKQKVALFIEF